MIPINFSQKKRELKYLAEKLHRLSYQHVDAGPIKIEKLIQKIKTLVHELAQVLSRAELKKILGTAALIIGVSFSNKANAQSFGAPLANPFGLESTNYLAFPAFADLDGDGDIDLLVGEYYGVLKYFQNTGTALNPQFAAPEEDPFGLAAASSIAIPAFADLDGDGDLDLLAGTNSGRMKYFQNTGSISKPVFAAPLINPFGLSSTYEIAFPTFADLDNDGDLDLLVGEPLGAMHYFQNTGSITTPEFAAPLLNPFGLDSTYYLAIPAFADLDGDSDMDLLVGEDYGVMQYFQNIGSASDPQFAAPLANPFGLVSTFYNAFPAFADLDGDGDTDLLVGEYYGVMQYFENLEIMIGIADVSPSFELKLYPNPVTNVLKIESDEIISRIEVFNTLGENIYMVEDQVSQIPLHDLFPGVYMVKVTSVKGNFITRKIQKL